MGKSYQQPQSLVSLKICVTGSNSRLFAGEGVTYLSGRYVELKCTRFP